MRITHHFTLLLISCWIIFPFVSQAQQIDMEKLHGLKPRSIGPAGMSGRVTAIDAVYNNPDIIYAGTASGGLWKTQGGGVVWEPIFDEQQIASIGAIAINQQNPDEIWVGTGEGNPRNSQNSGNGVYKSLDGGKTWQHLGLENTRNVHRIYIDKNNPDVVYVGAIGTAWADTPERGVYKTTDGGKTWKHMLYVNNRTGVGDMIMDPENPNKLIVAMWEYRRWPWFFKSGGEGSGLYVTFDGGNTWKQRTHEDGLPEGELGRIGLAVAASNPDVLYALVEARKNALYRSNDGGFTWTKTADENIGDRPFYYADIAVDPQNENRLYNVFSNVTVSHDGGKTFETLLGWDRVHGDHHAWWIHPDDPSFIINGNDGGMAISRDRGESWRFVENLPVGQFYHINVDMQLPYNVMGGMQDNGSWIGPAYVWRENGIRNAYWEEVSYGDGFDVLPDPDDPRYLYAMWQGGNLQHIDLETGAKKYIKPQAADDTYLRFNWNAAIAMDPFDSKTLYYGSQYIHKSTDKGETWEIISPDLTTNNPAYQKQLESGGLTYDATHAENYTTITAIAPSPVQEGMIWAGTDDGNVQVTQDGGANWTNVAGKIDSPKELWVQQIQASTYEAGEAFVVFDNHRKNDWTPYVYHTKDFGKSWTRLVDENDVWGYALSFVQDPVEPKLMFTGTEFGLYVSFDGGTQWNRWHEEAYPPASTIDMVIHPREHDLVIGTFGRSIYVLDDIRPLRAMAQEGVALLDVPLHVYEAPDAYLANLQQTAGTRFMADAIYQGENRPYGALITFSVKEILKEENGKKAETDSVKVEVLNSKNEVIRTFKKETKAGMNRFAWGLARKGVRSPNTPKPEAEDAPEPGGPPVMPGRYTVRITYGEHQAETQVNVKLDPRIELSEEDILARHEMADQLLHYTELATKAIDHLADASKTVDQVLAQLKGREGEAIDSLKFQGKKLKETIKAHQELIKQKEVQGILIDPHIVSGKIDAASLYFWSDYFSGFWFAPNATQKLALEKVATSLKAPLAQINGFFRNEWKDFQKAVEQSQVSLFEEYDPIGM